MGSWAIWTDTNLPQRGQRVKGKTIETRADVARARANGIEWYSKRDGEYCDSRRGKAAIEAYERSLREQGVREPMPIKLRSEKRHASRRRKVAC